MRRFHFFTRPPAFVPLGAVSLFTMVAASSIYWPQAMILQVRGELGEPAIVALLPGATLLGYALGVTSLAVASKNLAGGGGLASHAAILVTGLAALAAAPTATAAAIACLLVGAGCALTQRLLIIATTSNRPERRSEVIGLLIGSGLTGIVVARAWIGEIAVHVGWRQILVLDAFVVSIVAAALLSVSSRKPVLTVPQPASVTDLWKRYATLRHAAIHQAVIFAAFNAGWAVLPTLSTTAPAARATVAGIGAVTALVAGQAARRLDPGVIAATAPVFIAIAAATAAFVGTQTSLLMAMTCLEIGTQLALVANQTRAQAVAPDVGSRGRMASLVTATGFIGGALGAAAANMLVR